MKCSDNYYPKNNVHTIPLRNLTVYEVAQLIRQYNPRPTVHRSTSFTHGRAISMTGRMAARHLVVWGLLSIVRPYPLLPSDYNKGEHRDLHEGPCSQQ